MTLKKRKPRSSKRGSQSQAAGPVPKGADAKKPMTRQARWRSQNPLAYWAHVALQSGLRRGLVRRQPCEVCGAEKTDGHHDDYSRPLVVRWLCRRHHRQAHRKERAP
jgi:hypothetical protein